MYFKSLTSLKISKDIKHNYKYNYIYNIEELEYIGNTYTITEEIT